MSVASYGLSFFAFGRLSSIVRHRSFPANHQAKAGSATAVAIFSSAIYLGQTLGVAAGALVFDRFTAVPLFIATAVALPALAWWFAGKLRRRTMEDSRPKAKNERP